jgi:hypothetical protein
MLSFSIPIPEIPFKKNRRDIRNRSDDLDTKLVYAAFKSGILKKSRTGERT